MLVTSVVPMTKSKYKIYLDDQFAFVLYKGELSRYNLSEGVVISEDLKNIIMRDVILKRCKLRALHLLEDMPRTEYQLREKLKEGLYPESTIASTLEYVKSFGYVDDRQYAYNFIDFRKNTKSKSEIRMLLLQKGVDPEMIDLAFEEAFSEEDSKAAIRKLLEKRRFDFECDDPKEINRQIAYLSRKGFRYEDIRQVIQEEKSKA